MTAKGALEGGGANITLVSYTDVNYRLMVGNLRIRVYLQCQGISQTKRFNSNFNAMPGAEQPAGTVRRRAVRCLSQAARQRDQEAVCELLRNGGKYQRLLPLVQYTHTMQQWPKNYS